MAHPIIKLIFDRFGGATKLAEAMSRIEPTSVSTVHSWLSAKGGIPKWRRRIVVQAAYRGRVPMTPEMIAYLDPHGTIKPPRGYAEAVAAQVQPVEPESVEPPAPPMRTVILDAIIAAGSRGMTPDECAAATGLGIMSVRPRITELHRQGRVAPSGQRRSPSGRKTTIWEAK